MKLYQLLTILGLSLPGLSACAKIINWTDWQSSKASTATGELVVGTEVVTVHVTSAFAQTGTGPNFWTGSAYMREQLIIRRQQAVKSH